jgi:hypothetical protein
VTAVEERQLTSEPEGRCSRWLVGERSGTRDGKAFGRLARRRCGTIRRLRPKDVAAPLRPPGLLLSSASCADESAAGDSSPPLAAGVAVSDHRWKDADLLTGIGRLNPGVGGVRHSRGSGSGQRVKSAVRFVSASFDDQEGFQHRSDSGMVTCVTG